MFVSERQTIDMMKVLFVCSGNSKNGISPITKSQGESIMKYADVDVEYYTIKEKGIKGYYRSIRPLRKVLKTNHYDIVHAHFSLSAFVASFAGAKPLVVSLMGSDVKAKGLYRLAIRLFSFLFSWKKIIVKSEDMKRSLGVKDVSVIPNGVNLDLFYPIDKEYCRKKLGWDIEKTHILFPANPERKEKNYDLAYNAIKNLNRDNIDLHYFVNVPHDDTPYWYCASDVVILTSLWEGSPNAIKESMACNCVIVSTKVGDVEWLLDGVKGCYLTDFSVDECTMLLSDALSFSKEHGSTMAREKLIEIGLDSKVVAKKLFDIYSECIISR